MGLISKASGVGSGANRVKVSALLFSFACSSREGLKGKSLLGIRGYFGFDFISELYALEAAV
jgi:hypothetical protein